MRCFAIKDEEMDSKAALAYLFYQENAGSFFIELPENADPWNTPPLLSSFAKRGEWSVGSYWSSLWVEQRIIPRDRQNLGQILKENGLTEYDEFSLLVLADGRCAQDECYLEEFGEGELPAFLRDRWAKRVEEVVPMENAGLLVFFQNGETQIVDVRKCRPEVSGLSPGFLRSGRFFSVEVLPDGFGVHWGESGSILYQSLYEKGSPVPVSLEDFRRFARLRLVNVNDSCELLDCSRQNIDDLKRRGKLHPVRTDRKQTLFLKGEVMQRKKRDNDT